MDLTHLSEAFPAVVIQGGFLVKMNSDRELPRIHLESKSNSKQATSVIPAVTEALVAELDMHILKSVQLLVLVTYKPPDPWK